MTLASISFTAQVAYLHPLLLPVLPWAAALLLLLPPLADEQKRCRPLATTDTPTANVNISQRTKNEQRKTDFDGRFDRLDFDGRRFVETVILHVNDLSSLTIDTECVFSTRVLSLPTGNERGIESTMKKGRTLNSVSTRIALPPQF